MSTLASNPPRSLAPDVTLAAHDGSRFTLGERRGRSAVLVVFYRGHWCPYCRRYLCKLQRNEPRFRELGVQVVAISPEPVATSASLARELRVTFPLLCDSDGEAIEAFNVRSRFASTRALLPHPAVLLIDRGGVVRFRSVDRNYKSRTTMHTIFTEIERLLAAG